MGQWRRNLPDTLLHITDSRPGLAMPLIGVQPGLQAGVVMRAGRTPIAAVPTT
ncbi:hypothetical protein D560_2419 [Bordetella holmesii ATCC 51541]|nr:hypothetical protein D560_2419 [Bordetella holmesii ATCC 51541]